MASFELSPQQRHLWRLGPEIVPGPYLARCAVRLHGVVDQKVLGAALEDVIREHEVLRSRLQRQEGAGRPLQDVDPHVEPPLVVAAGPGSADVRGTKPEPGSAAAFSATLQAVQSDDHRLVLSLPSLFCDAHGLGHLVAAIRSRYAAHHGEPTAPEHEPFQYPDAAAWQNELLLAEEGRAGREHWSGLDIAPLLGARIPFSRRSRQGFDPQAVPVPLAEGIAVRLDARSAEHESSRSLWVLAAWQALILRLLGQSRPASSCAFDGRPFEELDGAVGLFARFLPLVHEVDEDMSFAELVTATGAAVRDSGAWQEYFAWETLRTDASTPEPFFPVAFEHLAPVPPATAAGVEFTVESREAQIDRFVLKLSYDAGAPGPRVLLWYDAAEVDAEDARMLADSFAALLECTLQDPARLLRNLNLMDAAARGRVLSDLAAGPDLVLPESCWHALVMEQARRTPDAIAAADERETLSYAELTAHAQRLSARLRALGVAPDTVVGLYVSRSARALAGILGILHAGGAYLPLDPLVPPARLLAMLEDCSAAVLVADEDRVDGIPGFEGTVVRLDPDPAEPGIDPAGTSLDGVGVEPGCLAYVLFTSGSTGRPKGVAVEHAQLANYVHAVRDRLDLPDEACYATVTTFAADLGHTAIFPALCTGGRVLVVPQDDAADPEALADLFSRHKPDVLKVVPSHLEALLGSPRAAELLPRQRLVLGGEACSWTLVDRVTELAPGCEVYNHYGPTEATVGVCAERLDGSRETRRSATPPIGLPLANNRAYVLDARGEPVPPWFPGELHLAGAQVARGYVVKAAASNNCFVADPIARDGARCYRTGDFARWLPDGRLEHLGRRDDQVKVRGFRVEPGEVAAALQRLEAVAEAAVLARNTGAERELVAYVTAAGRERPSPEDLREALAICLPDYMVPAAIVVMDALPLTANGKLDRGALPDPARPASSGRGHPPATDMEQALARVWCELLELESVFVNDNFYDLGGHSLLAIRAITEIERGVGVRLSPRELVFQSFGQVAAVCEARRAAEPMEGKL